MKFLLFGTGDYYERYKKWFDRDDIRALLDNSPEKQHTRLDGIEVLSPEEGIRLPFDVVVILSFYVKEMRGQLTGLGVPEDKIYHFYDLHHLIYSEEIKRPIQYYGRAEEIIMSGQKVENSILLLSHDLTLGGPAIALFHAAEILAKHGYEVVFASMMDGPLKNRLLDSGIPVVVDDNLQIETMKEAGWTGSFTLLLCNTINFHTFLSERDTDIPVIWWLHDSVFFYDGIDGNALCSMDRHNLQVCSVGPVPEKAIQKFMPDVHAERLLYGVTDVQEGREQVKKNGHQKVCFVTIGYIEARKGQDILLQAVTQLPDEIKSSACFYLVGQDTSMMAQKIKRETEHMPEIILTGVMDRKQINSILENADVLVCPSREDPMPTVAAEAMMHAVPCIVSDAAGTAAYIQDGIHGFVFANENVDGLTEKLIWCVVHREKLQEMGNAARGIYEQYFSMEIFEKRIIEVLDHMLR